jgi:hypothetical protein
MAVELLLGALYLLVFIPALVISARLPFRNRKTAINPMSRTEASDGTQE